MIKATIQNIQRRLKEELKIFKVQRDTGYEEGAIVYKTEDVYGRDLVEQIIDKIIKEEVGEELLK